MNKIILFFTIFTTLFFISCRNHTYRLKTNNTDKYQIEKRGDSLIICYIPNKNKGFKSIYILINNNYVDTSTKEVFLSNSLKIDTTIFNNHRIPYMTTKNIYKISKHECLQKLGKKYLSKDIYVTKYIAKSLYNDNKPHLMVAYYYDKKYNILKIVIPRYNVYTSPYYSQK